GDDSASAPRGVRGKLTDSDSEFELTLNERGERKGGARREQKDIFETDSDLCLGDSQAAALEEEDGDLESSDFDLAMEDSGSASKTVIVARGGGRRTQLACDDAARDDSMVTMSGAPAVFREEFDAMSVPAAAAPQVNTAAPAKPMPAAALPAMM